MDKGPIAIELVPKSGGVVSMDRGMFCCRALNLLSKGEKLQMTARSCGGWIHFGSLGRASHLKLWFLSQREIS